MAKIGRPGLPPEKKVESCERRKGGQCASGIAGLPFALNRLRELDPERLRDEATGASSGRRRLARAPRVAAQARQRPGAGHRTRFQPGEWLRYDPFVAPDRTWYRWVVDARREQRLQFCRSASRRFRTIDAAPAGRRRRQSRMASSGCAVDGTSATGDSRQGVSRP
jgi:hypothetical protein